MSSTFAEGTVRVTTPPSYDAAPAVAGGADTTRGLPDPSRLADSAARSELVAALGASDLELVQAVDLTPQPGRGGTKDLPGPHGTGTVQFDVDVTGDQDAVVLLERDG